MLSVRRLEAPLARRKRESFGSIRKLPSGRWRATYLRNAVEHVAPCTFTNQSEARNWLTTIRADMIRGIWVNPSEGRYSVEEIGTKWLKSNPGKAESSLKRDESIRRTHVYPTLGDRQVATVRRATIQELVNGWQGSASTVRRQYAALSAVFSYAELQEWITKSPCHHIKLPQQFHPPRRLPT